MRRQGFAALLIAALKSPVRPDREDACLDPFRHERGRARRRNRCGLRRRPCREHPSRDRHYRRLLEAAPDDPNLHYALGQLLLMSGDLAAGWDECEWRQQRPMPMPRWRGMPIGGAASWSTASRVSATISSSCATPGSWSERGGAVGARHARGTGPAAGDGARRDRRGRGQASRCRRSPATSR